MPSIKSEGESSGNTKINFYSATIRQRYRWIIIQLVSSKSKDPKNVCFYMDTYLLGIDDLVSYRGKVENLEKFSDYTNLRKISKKEAVIELIRGLLISEQIGRNLHKEIRKWLEKFGIYSVKDKYNVPLYRCFLCDENYLSEEQESEILQLAKKEHRSRYRKRKKKSDQCCAFYCLDCGIHHYERFYCQNCQSELDVSMNLIYDSFIESTFGQNTPFSSDPEISAFWQKFYESDLSTMISLFWDNMNDVFDDRSMNMLIEIHTKAWEQGELEQLEDILIRLLENFSDEMTNDQVYEFWYWLIEIAVFTNNEDRIEDILDTLGDYNLASTNFFAWTCEILLYFNYQQHLYKFGKHVVEKLRSKNETAEISFLIPLMLSIEYELQLENQENVTTEDLFDLLSQLIECIDNPINEYYREYGEKELKLFINKNKRTFKKSDFSKMLDQKQLLFNFRSLFIELKIFLHDHYGISYSTSELLREILLEYWIFGEQYSPKQQSRRMKNQYDPVIYIYEIQPILEIYSDKDPFFVSVSLQALPYILEFLVEKKLMSEDEFKKQNEKLEEIMPDILEYFEYDVMEDLLRIRTQEQDIIKHQQKI